MSKTYGAGIRCSICGAEPYPPDDPAIRETFNLTRLGPDGRAAEGLEPGAWFCEQHLPAKQSGSAKRECAASGSALANFEEILEAEGARLEEALKDRDDDGAENALTTYRREVARALAGLRKAFAPQKPASSNGAPKSRRPARKKIRPEERLAEGQQDWVNNAQSTPEASS